jgi:hypothetical protein
MGKTFVPQHREKGRIIIVGFDNRCFKGKKETFKFQK